jgi:ribose transport system substrate-binding protein
MELGEACREFMGSHEYFETFGNATARVESDYYQVIAIRHPAGRLTMPLEIGFAHIVWVMDGKAAIRIGEGDTVHVVKNGLLLIAGGAKITVSRLETTDIVYHFYIHRNVFQPNFFAGVSENNTYAAELRRILQETNGQKHWLAQNISEDVSNLLVSLIKSARLQRRSVMESVVTLRLALLLELLYDHNQGEKEELRLGTGEIGQQSRKSTEQALKIYNCIRQNITDVSLSFTAEKLYLHPNYLCRVVKDLFGKTFSDLVNTIRVDMAMDMLENSDDSIEGISQSLGYKNTNYFYRVFKECYGVTPGQMRDKLKQNSEPKTSEGSDRMPMGSTVFIHKLTSSKSIFDNLKYDPRDTARIAFLPASMEYNYIMSVGKTFSRLANDVYNAQVSISAPQYEDINVQIKMLEHTINSGVDAIMLNIHDEYAAAPLVKRAWENGIMVCMINYDNMHCPSLVHAIVGYRQRNATYNIGRYVIEKLQGESAKVGIIHGGSSYHSQERIGGFMDALKEHENCDLVSVLNGKWTNSGGFEATIEMLQSHPDINVLFCANDSEAAGAIHAIKTLKKDGIMVISNDGDITGLNNVKAGEIVATVNTMPNEMAKVALQVVMAGLTGKFHGGYVETPTRITDARNVDESLRQINRYMKGK